MTATRPVRPPSRRRTPVRHPGLRHLGRGARRPPRRRCATRSPTRGCAPTRVKANDVPAIVARLGAAGLDANVVSSGEWAAARAAGIPNDRITLEGIGKTPADLRAAVRAAADGRRCAGSRSRAPRSWRSWPRSPLGPGSAAGNDRPSTSCSASTPT